MSTPISKLRIQLASVQEQAAEISTVATLAQVGGRCRVAKQRVKGAKFWLDQASSNLTNALNELGSLRDRKSAEALTNYEIALRKDKEEIEALDRTKGSGFGRIVQAMIDARDVAVLHSIASEFPRPIVSDAIWAVVQWHLSQARQHENDALSQRKAAYDMSELRSALLKSAKSDDEPQATSQLGGAV